MFPERVFDDISDILREAYIMSQFDHVNVLNLMAIIWEQGEPPAVVTPYMGKGSLLNLIRKSDMVSLDPLIKAVDIILC